MSSGGLLQLVAYGAQDQYLTGNPEVTFFRTATRRHTNFSIEGVENIFNGNPNFGTTSDVKIDRNGDLAGRMYLKLSLPALDVSSTANAKIAWTPSVGLTVIEFVEFYIGGTVIDRQYGTWMQIWHELSRKQEQDNGYAKMVGNDSETTTLAAVVPARTLFVPMEFFFNQNISLSLPLIALQYHEVKLKFKFRALSSCLVYNSLVTSNNYSFSDCKLLTNYVFLDKDERRKFAQSAHEYLITQLQSSNSESVTQVNTRFRLNFNHPTKELVWAFTAGRYVTGRKFLAFNPNDFDNTLDIATRRFIHTLSAIYATTDRIITVSNTDTRILGSQSAAGNATLAALFAGLLPQVVGAINGSASLANTTVSGWPFANAAPGATSYGVDTASFNDITYEAPLSWRYASMPVDMLFNGVTRSVGTVESYMGFDVTVNDWHNHGLYLNHSVNCVATGLLKLNNHDRFAVQPGVYFNKVVPYEVHSATPEDGVNVYSFSVQDVEKLQPAGTCNFSRIDNTELVLTLSDGSTTFTGDFLNDTSSASANVMDIYGINYNVLRITSGMGGVAYAN